MKSAKRLGEKANPAAALRSISVSGEKPSNALASRVTAAGGGGNNRAANRAVKRRRQAAYGPATLCLIEAA